jgi:DNA-binding transcriptional LysR family regulator
MNKNTFEGIQYFISLTQLGSISLVAKELNVDHKTIKQKVNLLEKTINKQLVNSSYHGTKLTEEGWEFYHSVVSEYNLFERKVDNSSSDNLSSKNTMDFLLPPLASLFFSIHILPDLYRKHSDLLVNITTFDLAYMLSHGSYIRNTINQFNFMFIDENLIKLIDQDHWVLALTREEVQKFYASKKYLDDNKIQNISDLNHTNFISRAGTIEDAGFIEAKNSETKEIKAIHFKHNLTAYNDLLKAHLANQGLGVTLLSNTVHACCQHTDLINIFPEYEAAHTFKYYTLYKSNDVNTKYIKTILEIIKNKVITQKI